MKSESFLYSVVAVVIVAVVNKKIIAVQKPYSNYCSYYFRNEFTQLAITKHSKLLNFIISLLKKKTFNYSSSLFRKFLFILRSITDFYQRLSVFLSLRLISILSTEKKVYGNYNKYFLISGSDLLTSLTSTFDRKWKSLVNPANQSPSSVETLSVANVSPQVKEEKPIERNAIRHSSEYRDPSLHRSSNDKGRSLHSKTVRFLFFCVNFFSLVQSAKIISLQFFSVLKLLFDAFLNLIFLSQNLLFFVCL